MLAFRKNVKDGNFLKFGNRGLYLNQAYLVKFHLFGSFCEGFEEYVWIFSF